MRKLYLYCSAAVLCISAVVRIFLHSNSFEGGRNDLRRFDGATGSRKSAGGSGNFGREDGGQQGDGKGKDAQQGGIGLFLGVSPRPGGLVLSVFPRPGGLFLGGPGGASFGRVRLDKVVSCGG